MSGGSIGASPIPTTGIPVASPPISGPVATPAVSPQAVAGAYNQGAATQPAAPVPVGGAVTGAVQPAGVTQPVAQTTALPSRSNPTSYDPTPVSGGGLIEDFGSGVVGAMRWAQSKMNSVDERIKNILNSEGQVDPGMAQVLSREATTAEHVMEMLKKIEDTKDRATSAILR